MVREFVVIGEFFFAKQAKRVKLGIVPLPGT